MITPRTRTREWIENLEGKYDAGLAERMIMAFMLLEDLQQSGLPFTFKGGTSLSLITGSLKRFSIDIDIIVPPGLDPIPFFQKVITRGKFIRVEEDKRANEIPLSHFKFFFIDINDDEKYTLLDLLFDKVLYSQVHNIELKSQILDLDGLPTLVSCPSPECLLGDKLTAFAPHTTGIRYNNDKALEMAKQLFDIGTLFDYMAKLGLFFETYERIAARELEFRKLALIRTEDVLRDTLSTAFMLGMRGYKYDQSEYDELGKGIRSLRNQIYEGTFTPENAIVAGSKVAYLAALTLTHTPRIRRFDRTINLAPLHINARDDLQRLERLKKSSIEAFYYYFQTLELLSKTER
jgi:hypothetical protein